MGGVCEQKKSGEYLFCDNQKPPRMFPIKRKHSKSSKKLENNNHGDKIIYLPIDKITYELK